MSQVPSRKNLLKLGVPAVLIPGLILAASLGWNWREALKEQNYYQNVEIFPQTALVEPHGQSPCLHAVVRYGTQAWNV